MGGQCWSHSRAPWGLSPRTPIQRPRLGPAERAQPSGCGQRGQGSCPGGLPVSPASSFHPALKTLSFLEVQDGVVVISCAVGGQRGAVWGGLLQLLPDPTAAPWGDGLRLSFLALTSPHAKALAYMADTNSTLFSVPGSQPRPLSLGWPASVVLPLLLGYPLSNSPTPRLPRPKPVSMRQ